MAERAAGGGLTSEGARALLAVHGPNRLVPGRRRSATFDWLLRAVSDPMAVLLLLASATYFALQDYVEAAVTVGALVPITAVTLLLERRAERALEQLRRRTAPTATVWRDERRQTIPAEELVPGDLILVFENHPETSARRSAVCTELRTMGYRVVC